MTAVDGTARRVLVVEDEAADRMAIERALGQRGGRFVVVGSATGAEGLARCAGAEPPDCVLLDYRLPDMTALEFLAALRGDGEMMPLPVAVLTGQNDDRAAAASLAAGAEDFVIKGAFDPQSLARIVENAIENHAIRTELQAERLAVELRNRKLESLRDELQAKVAELGEATRAKDRFLAVMSHEMRTPLNAILGYSDLLDMQVDGSLSASQRGYINRIRVGSRHLLDLINNVLDLTRADVRKLQLDLRPVDAVAVAEEVVALLESEAMSSGVTLALKVPPGPAPLVEADLQRFRQILTNLVGNALKFIDRGAVTVTVEVAEGGDVVLTHVDDTGIGIEPEVLPLIFDEFYQAKGDLTRRHGGSGLGLAISRQLAELMHGTITVSSTVGKGSRFTLALPLAVSGRSERTQDVDAHRDWKTSQEPAPAAAPVTVVALGADPAALEALERRVAPAVALHWTVDPIELIELAKSHTPALVVLDIGAGNSAGWNAAFTIQEEDALRETPVLLLPSIPAAGAADRVPGLDLGWVSLVPKPFTPGQLSAAITRATGRAADATSAPDVLIVDDDPDSRRVAAQFLEGERTRVREAPDGETALAMMRVAPPDIVVLDLMMPVLDGFGVMAAMRADPLLTSIPVVVLTAKSLTEAERQFLSRTAARVLQKGQHRLADVASLVLRAATRQRPREITPTP